MTEPPTARGSGAIYPRAYQVSLTEETAAIIERVAREVAAARRLPKPSVSLIIREAVERQYGGAHNPNSERTTTA